MALPIRIRWTLPRRLAAAALALGVIAMAGDPVRGHVVTIDTQELAHVVGTSADRVSAADLADWIVRGAADYRLVDLRDAAAYAEYHVPTAEHLPMTRLTDAGLARNEKIVLCSEDGLQAAQAWMLLRAQGYRGVYVLAGGLAAWRDEVVFPVAPSAPTPREAALFERAVQVARFFGGQPREASAAGGGPPSLAQVARPAGPAVPQVAMPLPGAGGGARKPKEGC